jgi:hypothetical protein
VGLIEGTWQFAAIDSKAREKKIEITFDDALASLFLSRVMTWRPQPASFTWNSLPNKMFELLKSLYMTCSH